MLFHFRPKASVVFYSGGLFVEFYFMLTGGFAITWSKNNGGTINEYVKKLYLSVFPYVLTGVLLIYFKLLFLDPDPVDIVTLLKRMASFPFEICLLQCTGIYRSYAYVFWYISIVMLCLPVYLTIHKKFSVIWQYCILVFPVICHGYLLRTIGTVRTNDISYIVWIRAFGGLFYGGLALFASNVLQRCVVKYSIRVNKLILTGLECLLWLCSLFLITRRSLSKTIYDEIVVFLFLFAVILAWSNLTYTCSIPKLPLCKYYSKISLAIYSFHYGIYGIIPADLFEHNAYIIVGGITTIVCSILFTLLIESYIRPRVRTYLKNFCMDSVK